MSQKYTEIVPQKSFFDNHQLNEIKKTSDSDV